MVTPAQPNRLFLAPGDKLGKHEVIRQIAVGGMAELYLTRTVGIEGFEKLVCVKRILPQYIHDPSFVAMFLKEARLAATLHHPNIAQVYDIGQELGEYFFSMEYVHGEDLGRLVATGRDNGVQISLDCALTVGAGLCAGLHHAHEKTAPDGKLLGVVHRDVSPSNVLISYDGSVKLVDFGIARAGSEPSTAPNGLKGKIPYMSPEQCRGRVLDRRSDVFAIGTILYELTTGQVPFDDATDFGVMHQIVNRDADPPTTLVPSYPPALEAIVMRALARDPDRRYATALELQTQLEDFAHDNRLRISPLVLARLMSTVFPARLEEWDHARAQGAFFVEQHVVRTLIESGKTADRAARYTPLAVPIVGAPGAGVEPGTAPTSTNVDQTERTQIGPEPGQMVVQAPVKAPVKVPVTVPTRVTPRTAAAQPQTIAAQPRTTPQTIAAQPRTTPQTIAAQPRTTPQTIAAQPRTTPQTIAAQPRTTPQTIAAQPRTTPQTIAAQAAATLPGLPAVTGPSAAAGGRGASRPAPVPNMPGAVPIMRTLPAPPVPSGGTLVSSATQAGPPPVMAPPLKPPMFTPAGSGDFGAYRTASDASGYPGPAGSYPGPAGSYPGPSGSYPGPSGSYPAAFAGGSVNHTAADGLSGRRRSVATLLDQGSDESDGDDFGRETAHHTVANLNARVRAASARKTEEMRSQAPSRRPIIAIVLGGVAAAAIGVWFAVHTTRPAEPARLAPSNASNGSVAADKPAPSPPAPTPAAPSPPAPTPVAPSPPAPSPPAPSPVVVPATTAVVSPPVYPDDKSADLAKPKRVHGVAQPSPKAVKPSRVRAEPKRSVRPKAEPKEETWNNDSPFLPEPTPKR